ncbi:MAG: hypothetical protein ABI405_09965 [Parafilimonas sp.]
MFDFLKNIILFFNEAGIEYMLSGSVALSIYILPRATRDFDFVVHLQKEDVNDLVDHFSKKYYCDKAAVLDAVTRKSIFNVIDSESGFKADFVILKNEKFRQTEFSRRSMINLHDLPVYIVSAEDLLLSKLIWIQDFQSHIQMEDIKNLAALDNLEWYYINEWIMQLKLNTFDLL